MGVMVEVLLEEKVVGWQEREQREDSEGWCGDYYFEGEVLRFFDVEGFMVIGGWRVEVKEIELESLEDVRGQEEWLIYQVFVEVVLGLVGEVEMVEVIGSVRGGVVSSWSEVLFFGFFLDVFVLRSCVYFLRSFLQCCFWFFFCWILVLEQQEEFLVFNFFEEELLVFEQRFFQLEEFLELSFLRYDGILVLVRRRFLGYGFDFMYFGMMQEL